MSQEPSRLHHTDDRPGVGVILASIQIAAYFLFVVLCSFAPDGMRTDFLGSGIPLGFVAGMAIIVLGVVLTALYVFSCRTSSPQ